MAAAEAVRIVVPYDCGRLSPNKRLHWAERAKRAKCARLGAWMAWQDAGRPTFDVPVDVRITIRRGRVLDPDNAMASVKNLCDGIFNATKNGGGATLDDSEKWVRFVEIRQETGKNWVGFEEVEFCVTPRKEAE